MKKKPLSKKADQIQKGCRRFYFEEDVKEAVENLKEELTKEGYLPEYDAEPVRDLIDKIFGSFEKWKTNYMNGQMFLGC